MANDIDFISGWRSPRPCAGMSGSGDQHDGPLRSVGEDGQRPTVVDRDQDRAKPNAHAAGHPYFVQAGARWHVRLLPAT
ncbi:hypothetical protein [Mesorhizobium sp. M0701]|uniref:hypothetical protein n=1 Tax=Mesorhizobium sp. M0701 TaxID=2956989 RepID=UPI003337D289